MKTIPYFCLMAAVIVSPHVQHTGALITAWCCLGVAVVALAIKTFAKDHH